MPSRLLTDLHPLLVQEYQRTQQLPLTTHPSAPQPFITCTYRPLAEQAALHAQSRLPLANVNALRKVAGLPPISQEENKKRVTNAQPGSSAHNFQPSFAFDIALISIDHKLDWSDKLFRHFALLFLSNPTTAPQLEWGGSWTSIKDLPHFQLRNWRQVAGT